MWDVIDHLVNYLSKVSSETRINNLSVNHRVHVFTVDSIESGIRLDKFLRNKLSPITRSFLQNLIKKGQVRVNNHTVKSGAVIKSGDQILIEFPKPEPSHIQSENIPLNIVFEDEHLLIINKPAGMVVHPGAGNRRGTLVNALLYHCTSLSGINGVLRPGIVHRLDKNTSGLLVVAKNDISHLNLSQQFETRTICRTYFAIIWGVTADKEGKIITKIGRSKRDRKKMSVKNLNGKEAITEYKLLNDYLYLSAVELTLKTGRTHQIRVHLNHINHPVFGDPDYNGRSSQLYRLPQHLYKRGITLLNGIKRQALHAKKIQFIHPVSNKNMAFESELPEDILNILVKIPNQLMFDINQE